MCLSGVLAFVSIRNTTGNCEMDSALESGPRKAQRLVPTTGLWPFFGQVKLVIT